MEDVVDLSSYNRADLEHEYKALANAHALLKRIREIDSSRDGNGLPLWAKVVSVVGFPVVVTMILLGMLTGYVPSPIASTHAMVAQHISEEGQRTRIIRVMCRHQAMSLRQGADECDR